MKKNLKSYIVNLSLVTLLYLGMQLAISTGMLDRYYQGIIIFICINIVLATSLNLALGFLGQLALGHAGFMATGAYMSAVVAVKLRTNGLPNIPIYNLLPPNIQILIIGLLTAGIFSAIVSLLVGIPALRLRGDYLGIMTLGFGEVIRVIINNTRNLTGGAQGFTGIPRITTINNVYWITVIIVTILYTLTNSRHGRAIISIREDEIAAEAVGIQTTKYKVMGFAISAFFAGIGGGLFAHYLAFLDPNTFNFMKSVEIVVIVVLGGMGSLTGSVIAAIVLTILPEALRGFANYRMLIYSIILVVMMIFRPQGIFGTSEFSLREFVHKIRYNPLIAERKEFKGGE